jgi:hemoglobin
MKREEGTAVATRPLYQRLGGAAGISAIVDDVIDAHVANPLVGHHFRAIKDLDKTKRMARDFFCAGAGGPEKYAGRDMRTAHQGMNVSEAEFVAVVEDVMNVLQRHAIDRDTQNDVLAILNGFRNDILHG